MAETTNRKPGNRAGNPAFTTANTAPGAWTGYSLHPANPTPPTSAAAQSDATTQGGVL